MPSMLIINNMKKSSIDFKAFIATKTDRIHNIDFNGTLMSVVISKTINDYGKEKIIRNACLSALRIGI